VEGAGRITALIIWSAVKQATVSEEIFIFINGCNTSKPIQDLLMKYV
jgi:hypothetical protein